MKKPKIRVNRHTVSALCILGILGIIITLITLYNVLHPLIQQTMPSISVFPTYINTCSEIIVSWKNMRKNYQIRYLCGNVVFRGPIVKVNANFPMQGHLALTGDSSEMRYQ
jgi:hypothetical protein